MLFARDWRGVDARKRGVAVLRDEFVVVLSFFRG